MMHHLVRALAVCASALLVVTSIAAVEPASAATFTISGNVSYEFAGNHPIAARVAWTGYSNGRYVAGPEYGVPTEANGDYSIALEPGDYRIQFIPMDSLHQRQFWNNIPNRDSANVIPLRTSNITGIDAVLARYGSISGQVRVGPTARLAGAGEVEVVHKICVGPACGSDSAPVTTDAQGNYSFPSVLDGTHVVTFRIAEGTEFQPATRTVTISRESYEATGIDATLSPAGSFSGRVALGDSGSWAPAGSVKVTAWLRTTVNGVPHPFSTLVGADGDYLIDGLSTGSYYLEYDYLGTGAFADMWSPGVAFGYDARSIQVTTSDVRQDIVMPRASTLTGRITNSQGEALDGVTVVASARDSAYGLHTMGSSVTVDGVYVISGLPAEDYFLDIQGQALGYARTSYGLDPTHPERVSPIPVGVGETTVADYTLYRPMTVEGRVTCDSCSLSSIAPNTWIRLERDVSVSGPPVWQDEGSSSGITVSPSSPGVGTYSIPVRAPGRFRVVAIHYYITDHPASSGKDLFTLEDGETRAVDVALDLLMSPGGDFSGDDRADILVRNPSGALLRYAGTGTGMIGARAQIGTGWNGFDLVIAPGDFSGDGNPDVIARTPSGDLYLYRTSGTGGFLPGKTRIGTGWHGFDTVFGPGDFSGDGTADLIGRTSTGELYLYRGNGTGGFLPGKTRIGTGWHGFDTVFGLGDFTGDSFPDVVARTPSGELYLYRGNGIGGFLPGKTRIGTGWGGFTAVISVGDFTGDTRPDVIGRAPNGDLFLYRGNGAGGFSAGSTRIGAGWGGLMFVS